MRILTVVRSLGLGGTERAAQNFAVGYAARGISSHVFAWGTDGPRRKALETAGVAVSTPSAGSIDHVLDVARPEVVHIHREGRHNPSESALLDRIAARSIPVMETNVFGRPDYSPTQALIDCHLHLSTWSMWKWSRWLGAQRESAVGVVVPYAVDVDQFRPTDPAAFLADLGATGPVIGRVGQPIEGKWSSPAVDAMLAAARRRPELLVVLVGPPPSVRRVVEGSGVAARVRVIDRIESDELLTACYSALGAFVHSARIGESFGMVLAEAMSCGTPVVTQATPLKDNTQVEIVAGVSRCEALPAGADYQDAIDRALESTEADRSAIRESMVARFALPVVVPAALTVAAALVVGARGSALEDALSAAGLTVRVDDSYGVRGAHSGGLGRRERLAIAAVHNRFLFRAYSSSARPLRLALRR